ncbi:HlyD family efflux transporter periplasmic adaptor subunit [Starkeya koreensis]|uniref:HlyD family efflux transporter periplasmic adaptor subunit n=1 Tax=Ancylobacter koreensis TaxID=266121 RepID=A0ABT0DK39_9HYPH|nr:efflux RND transporter periplasmic adaptor subunit [Ancylobacter koreensis]MCK0207636.1 HlyD family efflux transporter periplasmic adaptor subunit [Ancylobacter koreensis]
MLSRLLRHPVLLIVGTVVGLFALYEISVRFVAYTGDAYVMSDIVVISSEIEGPVSRLAVQNNQSVAANQLLFEIERTPYALKAQEAQAALAQAKADLDLANDEVAAARANLTSALAVQTNAQDQLNRVKTLEKEGYSPEATLDIATRDVATAGANVAAAEAQLSVATRRVAVAGAVIGSAEAALGKAQYDLSKTVMSAPEAGRITPFTVRQGDYLRTGTPVLAIVTDRRRRVVANVSERHLARIRIGQRVLLTLGSDPWAVHLGRVSGIAGGVSRSPDNPQVVPYVEPTTDWVRLPRRFPVEVTLDDWPEGLGLFNGADARVLIRF